MVIGEYKYFVYLLYLVGAVFDEEFVRWLRNSIKYHIYHIIVALVVLGVIYGGRKLAEAGRKVV